MENSEAASDPPTPKPMAPQSAARQVNFHTLLSGARNKVLIDALSDALGKADPVTLKAEILEYIPHDVQRILAKAGIRDEHVFPLPSVLEQAPTLVGYYRLLLGVPQKTFYSGTTGMGQVKGMEMKGSLNAKQLVAIPQFCKVMGEAFLILSGLYRQRSLRAM